jgi:alpha-galactosidase
MRASLQPGEEIRTPSILLMAWRANDSAEGHNQFRRLLLEHFTPRIAGKPVVPPISAGPHAIISFEKTTEANLLECIANISEHNLPVDNFWLDAGWYACPQDPSGWDKTTGTWTPDPERFPRGLRPIADAAKQHGFRPVLYDIPRGCAAAYYPETNVLVAIDEHAVKSFTPMSKYIEVTLLPCA